MVPYQPPGLDEPSESPFHDPSFRQSLESLHVIGSLDDLKLDPSVTGYGGHLLLQFPRIAAVGPDPFEPAVAPGQRSKQLPGPVANLHIRCGHLQREEVACGI